MKRSLPLFALLLCSFFAQAQADKVRQLVQQRQQQLLQEYLQFVAIPNVMGDSINIHRNAAFIQQMIEGRLDEVDQFDIDAISHPAGRSTHEVRTWVAAFSALRAACGSYHAQCDYYRPINEWIAGYGVVSAQGQ